MKKLTLIFLTLVVSNMWLKGSDTLRLFNGKLYSGEVLKVKKNYLEFLGDNGIEFKIPMNQVLGVKFEDVNGDLAFEFEDQTDKYLAEIELANWAPESDLLTSASSMESYSQGQMDARMYHGKGFGYGVAGFLLGPFGYLFLIGDSKFMPQNASSAAAFVNDRDLNDWQYLEGYKKKARGKQAGNVTIGWAIWIGLVLLI